MSVERRVLISGRATWLARWYDPTGAQRSRSFPTKRQAADHLAQVRSDMRIGDWHDPAAGAATLVSLPGES